MKCFRTRAMTGYLALLLTLVILPPSSARTFTPKLKLPEAIKVPGVLPSSLPVLTPKPEPVRTIKVPDDLKPSLPVIRPQPEPLGENNVLEILKTIVLEILLTSATEPQEDAPKIIHPLVGQTSIIIEFDPQPEPPGISAFLHVLEVLSPSVLGAITGFLRQMAGFAGR